MIYFSFSNPIGFLKLKWFPEIRKVGREDVLRNI
jgi:hypothetical protein